MTKKMTPAPAIVGPIDHDWKSDEVRGLSGGDLYAKTCGGGDIATS